MTSINTNSGALTAHRNMLDQSSKMEDAMARLSSGLRINSAADDAAGSAIASKMESQVRSLGVAIRNSYDAISMTQTAEGALGEMENILQRVRELSVQAGNSTLSSVDRSMIQSEVDALLKEVDSIAQTTNFNGVNLLDGVKETVTFQIGINATDALDVSLKKSDTVALGLSGSMGVNTLSSERIDKTNYNTSNLAKGDVKINGFDALSTDFTTDLSSNSNAALEIAKAINLNTGNHGATADSFNNLTSVGKGPFSQTATFTINSNTVALATSYVTLVDNINESVSGVVAVLNADNTITLSNKTGADIVIAEVGSGVGASDVGFTAGTYTGMVSLVNNDGTAVRIEAGSVKNGYALGVGTVADVNGLGFNESSNGTTLEGAIVSGTALKADEIRLNDVIIGPSDNGSANSIAAAINSKTTQHGVTADAQTEAVFSLNTNTIPTEIKINGNSVNLSTATDLAQIVTKINAANIGDILASTNSEGKLTLTSESGVDISVTHNKSSDFIERYQDIHGSFSNFGIQKGISDIDFVVAAETKNATNMTLTAAVQANTNLNSFVVVRDVAGNAQTGNTFTITGTDMDGNALTEEIKGPVASTIVVGEKVFKTITNVAVDGNTTGNVSVGLAKTSTDIDSLVTATDIGAAGAYTLDGALSLKNGLDAFVMITGTAAETGNTFTITGTDRFGNVISENVVGGAASVPAQSTKRFGTVTGISTSGNSGSVQIGTTRDFFALTAANETETASGLHEQTNPNAAGALAIDGALANFTDLGAVVNIVSTHDETAKTFTINGTDMDGNAVQELIVGANAGTSTGNVIFKTVTSASISAASTNNITIGATSVFDSFTVRGNLSMTTDKNSTIKIDSVVADQNSALVAGGTVRTALNKIGMQNQSQSFEVSTGGLDVTTESGAAAALASIDSAINSVSEFRSSFGAVENRIDASINNLTTLKINTEAAQSRIMDADFAQETSNLTKSQILSQAATSMLAQANASKQNLLALLQG